MAFQGIQFIQTLLRQDYVVEKNVLKLMDGGMKELLTSAPEETEPSEGVLTIRSEMEELAKIIETSVRPEDMAKFLHYYTQIFQLALDQNIIELQFREVSDSRLPLLLVSPYFINILHNAALQIASIEGSGSVEAAALLKVATDIAVLHGKALHLMESEMHPPLQRALSEAMLPSLSMLSPLVRLRLDLRVEEIEAANAEAEVSAKRLKSSRNRMRAVISGDIRPIGTGDISAINLKALGYPEADQRAVYKAIKELKKLAEATVSREHYDDFEVTVYDLLVGVSFDYDTHLESNSGGLEEEDEDDALPKPIFWEYFHSIIGNESLPVSRLRDAFAVTDRQDFHEFDVMDLLVAYMLPKNLQSLSQKFIDSSTFENWVNWSQKKLAVLSGVFDLAVWADPAIIAEGRLAQRTAANISQKLTSEWRSHNNGIFNGYEEQSYLNYPHTLLNTFKGELDEYNYTYTTDRVLAFLHDPKRQRPNTITYLFLFAQLVQLEEQLTARYKETGTQPHAAITSLVGGRVRIVHERLVEDKGFLANVATNVFGGTEN